MRALKATEECLQRLTGKDVEDTEVSFENSGADYLFVGWAYYCKNSQRICNITELKYANSSERAEDLALELRLLRDRRGRHSWPPGRWVGGDIRHRNTDRKLPRSCGAHQSAFLTPP